MLMVNSQQVLIIEDDEDTQGTLEDMLCQLGYETVSAATAADALSSPVLRQCGLVLLDRILPDSTAEELLPELKRRSPEGFVVVMTGHGDLHSAVSCMRLGALDYLLKPVDDQSLMESLERVRCARHVSQQRLQAVRLAAIADAMTGLSHECRNALQRGQASVDMLMDELSGNSSAILLIERIQAAQDDLQRLYEDVKSYAQPVRLSKSVFHLEDVACAAWEELLARHVVNGATLSQSIDAENTMLKADSNALRTVFRNLLENSLAARCDAAIEVSYRDASNSAESALIVTVSDNGPGIADGIREKVFDEFFTTRMRGTGLGLTICRRLVTAHHGTIGLAPTGSGTELLMVLPRN